MSPPREDRRRLLAGALCGGGLVGLGGLGLAGVAGLSACGSDAGARAGAFAGAGASKQQRQTANAVAQLDELAGALMNSSGLPGMAVAVVQGEQVLYAKGFGVRVAGTQAPVDADTVFQLASVSKSIGATVVAHQIGLGGIAWETPVRRHLPWFALSDPEVSAQVTIGDMYAHRTGLPATIGDRLEDMGYDRRQVLERLRHVPLKKPFRGVYGYANFGTTTGAVAVAAAAGTDWAALSQQVLYQPLGMRRTSSRFADFQARDNRVVGHVKVDGRYVPGPVRMPDAQAPAASVTSSVNDLAKWLSMLLGGGVFQGRRIVDAEALAQATQAQIQTAPASGGRRASAYGFGFNVGTTAAGHASFSHSGAFSLGAGTTFVVVPATGLAIVVLTNSSPVGIAETLAAQFFDLVQFGTIQRPWQALYEGLLAPGMAPEGSLVGASPPARPQPAQPLAAYTGSYRNDFYGPLQVAEEAGALMLRIGPAPLQRPLAHRDGDVFTFTLFNENAPPGTISKASFAVDRVTLEYYDGEGLGTFLRAGR